MRTRFVVASVFVSVLGSVPAEAACRTYHYDHDGNPHTPSKFNVACEQSFDVRKIPKYRVQSIDVSTGRTLVRKPRHIKLPTPKPKCEIPSIYHFAMMQTLSVCTTTR